MGMVEGGDQDEIEGGVTGVGRGS